MIAMPCPKPPHDNADQDRKIDDARDFGITVQYSARSVAFFISYYSSMSCYDLVEKRRFEACFGT
jgi:hypothetical protein